MNTKSIILGIATVIGLGVAGQAGAQPYTNTWQVRGNGAYATAYTDNGCEFTALDISVNDNVVHGTGDKPVSESGAWAGYWAYDWCKGTEAYGWGYVANVPLSGNLSSASTSMTFQVEMFGWVETPEGYWDYVYLGQKPLTITATWTGTGETFRGMESWTGRWGRTIGRYRWLGSSRNADVSLSATLGSSPMTFEITYGSIGSYQSGTTDVYHY